MRKKKKEILTMAQEADDFFSVSLRFDIKHPLLTLQTLLLVVTWVWLAVVGS
jgi:hypothetical protein